MKRKAKEPQDGVVAARLPLKELNALKRVAEKEKRNLGNMIRVMIAEGVALREKNEDSANAA